MSLYASRSVGVASVLSATATTGPTSLVPGAEAIGSTAQGAMNTNRNHGVFLQT